MNPQQLQQLHDGLAIGLASFVEAAKQDKAVGGAKSLEDNLVKFFNHHLGAQATAHATALKNSEAQRAQAILQLDPFVLVAPEGSKFYQDRAEWLAIQASKVSAGSVKVRVVINETEPARLVSRHEELIRLIRRQVTDVVILRAEANRAIRKRKQRDTKQAKSLEE